MANGDLLSTGWLTQHIRENIPLAETMQYEVLTLTGGSITVSAPLLPNINVHGTGFAGSLYSLAVLTAWGLTTVIVREAGVAADVVVSKAEIEYRHPVKTDIHCQCICEADLMDAFIEALKIKGRARLSLNVIIGDADEALLKARMVAIKHR